MDTAQLKIECELLKRTKRTYIMAYLLGYIGFYLFTKFLTPSYSKGRLVYKGLLAQYHFEDSIPYAYILQVALLIFVSRAAYKILTYSLIIKGVIIITESGIEVIRWKKFKYYFKIDEIKNLKIQFNYLKKNDIEPRNMVTGNNNIIEFTKFNQTFNYEFLMQTEEEDEIFRAILSHWESKNINFEYKTVLSDF